MKQNPIIRTVFLSFILLSTLALSTQRSLAQVPRRVSYQGVLESGGSIVADGSYVLSIRLYDAPSGGNLLFSESHNAVVARGVFHIELGSNMALPDSLTFDKQY